MGGVLKRRSGSAWIPVGSPVQYLTEADIPAGDEDDFVALDGSGGLKSLDSAPYLTEADIPTGSTNDLVALDGSGGFKTVDSGAFQPDTQVWWPLTILTPSVGNVFIESTDDANSHNRRQVYRFPKVLARTVATLPIPKNLRGVTGQFRTIWRSASSEEGGDIRVGLRAGRFDMGGVTNDVTSSLTDIGSVTVVGLVYNAVVIAGQELTLPDEPYVAVNLSRFGTNEEDTLDADAWLVAFGFVADEE